MGLVISFVSQISKFLRNIINLHRKINGNWPTYLKLKRKIKNEKLNKRFDLHENIRTNDPYSMSMLPFDQEWQMECPGTVSESIF